MSVDLRNIKLLISYDGSSFSGWQRQKNERTIQGEIEYCLRLMTRDKIDLHGAGRTDAGVHAEGMVAHFTTGSAISCHDFMRGMNAMLPGAIRIFSVEEVDLAFHARFSATGKCYHYNLYTGKIQPPHLRLYSVHVARPLHIPAIKECLHVLQGSHDFSSFENSGSRDKGILFGRGAVRIIYRADLIETAPFQLTFQFVGDGFLRNMIRNFIGSLLQVGQKKLSVNEFNEILQAKDRTKAAATAPAHGLFLKEVFYERH